MILHVTEVTYLHDYVIWVRFSDGAEGEVDLVDELEGEVFEPLKDLQLFRGVRVDPLLKTLVWPNGADVAPEFLYEKMRPADYPGRAGRAAGHVLAVREERGRYVKPQPRKRKKQ